MILNRKEVADVFGCSLPTVDAWIAEGAPVKQAGSRGVEWQFESVDVHKWLVAKARNTRRTRGNRYGEGEEDPPDTITHDEADRRQAVAKAKLAELTLAEEMARVAPVEAIAKVVSDEIANAKARILAIPTKVRPSLLMHARDEARAKALVAEVETLIREALAEIKSYGAAA